MGANSVADDQARDLRQRGILAAKAGNKDEARKLLQQSIRLEPRSEPAWLWLASVARDPQERLFSLQKLLEINPQNEMGRKALESMQASGPSIKPITGVFIQPPTPQNLDSTAPVPLPTAEQISDAQRQADAVVRAYMNPPVTPIHWTHKTKGRAGERDSVVLRAQIAAVVVASPDDQLSFRATTAPVLSNNVMDGSATGFRTPKAWSAGAV